MAGSAVEGFEGELPVEYRGNGGEDGGIRGVSSLDYGLKYGGVEGECYRVVVGC